MDGIRVVSVTGTAMSPAAMPYFTQTVFCMSRSMETPAKLPLKSSVWLIVSPLRYAGCVLLGLTASSAMVTAALWRGSAVSPPHDTEYGTSTSSSKT